MAKKQKKKKGRPAQPTAPRVKDFLDMIAPTAVKFNTDSYVLGSSFRCTLALRSYPATTEELALLCHLGEKSGVALHIYIRQAAAGEEDAIIHNAQNKNRMDRGNTNNMRRSVTAEANLQDVESLITTMRRNKEPLLHCAVFIELCARDADGLRVLRDEVTAALTRSKLGADRLFLVQRNGFLASNPAGSNIFASQFERVLPASSVANLFPFNYSGKNDPNGFYIGRDRCGSNIILDLDRRSEDKTNANVLILGNSGQGKSSCFFCPSMKKKEIRTLYHQHRDLYERAIAIEDAARPNLISVKGLGRNWAWRDFVEADRNQTAMCCMFPEDDLPCNCHDGG